MNNLICHEPGLFPEKENIPAAVVAVFSAGFVAVKLNAGFAAAPGTGLSAGGLAEKLKEGAGMVAAPVLAFVLAPNANTGADVVVTAAAAGWTDWAPKPAVVVAGAGDWPKLKLGTDAGGLLASVFGAAPNAKRLFVEDVDVVVAASAGFPKLKLAAGFVSVAGTASIGKTKQIYLLLQEWCILVQ